MDTWHSSTKIAVLQRPFHSLVMSSMFCNSLRFLLLRLSLIWPLGIPSCWLCTLMTSLSCGLDVSLQGSCARSLWPCWKRRTFKRRGQVDGVRSLVPHSEGINIVLQDCVQSPREWLVIRMWLASELTWLPVALLNYSHIFPPLWFHWPGGPHQCQANAEHHTIEPEELETQ